MGMKRNRPRRGSLAFSPRKRAKRPVPKIRSWPERETVKLLAFPVYKAGTTHALYKENNPKSPNADQDVFTPVTVMEAPDITIAGIRAYGKDTKGLKALTEVWADSFDKELGRKINLPKEPKANTEKLDEVADKIVEVRAIVHTNPKDTNLPKKKPEIIEIKIGGKNISDIIAYAKDIIGKKLSINDVFTGGEFIDTVAITKGKGFQGPVKRWGIKIQFGKHQNKGVGRHTGSIGPWTPKRIMWTVPMAGQVGFHQRTEYNKRILKIGENGSEIVPKGGFLNYGVVKNNYVLVKGSVQGPAKRMVVLREAIRNPEDKFGLPELTYVSTESKQGN
ncbi:50S ribosomal protein L3 [Methanococcus aeolicus]|jgi:large subunit ribosomal protein L3|uniref:Large ribosomal subunit protein uL3 n=1 Tax=Methanococcus aeolicus (strain ATCC BAA-1280 / DSM 17508 / OCM 812 / Nankai-3) TaxID=419665 RepID=RL3_META3|nr:50S ribosomal protein L3 [Methanococcus aeolicus]A6UV68.1 RecName: Full=Large ribosomal subunit protein uL3; AltName: Full=50S ribosomal protein L3 [Methanococcus aeolicus Nankai-3]ABR56390.1 ribosomal protein L3 [Methanococcus aeolicus Nankai-3]UXM84388.1 50S ribosomal protein L3 [Methanococcus aeolicus]